MKSRRAVTGTVLLAVLLGALVALPLGQRREQLSVDLWLLATGLWFTLLFVRGVFDAVPVEAVERRSLWRRKPRPAERPMIMPRELVALEGTVIGGRDSTRAFSRRLQPRLIDLSAHLLTSRHGIDAERQPDRAAEVLGDVAWLIDPTTADRPVRVEEMHQLLDRLGHQDQTFDQIDGSIR